MRISFAASLIVVASFLIPSQRSFAAEKSKLTQYWDDAWAKAQSWQKDAALASASAIVDGDGSIKSDAPGVPLALVFSSKSANQQLYVTLNPADGKLKSTPMQGSAQMQTLPRQTRSLDDALAAARKAGLAADTLVSASLLPDGSGQYQWMIMSPQTAKAYYVGPTGAASDQPGGTVASNPPAPAENSTANVGSSEVHLKSTIATEASFSHQDGAGAISSDLTLAIGGNQIINTATGKVVRTIGAPQLEAHAVALSPDARQAAIAGDVTTPSYHLELFLVDLTGGHQRSLYSANAPLDKSDSAYRNNFHALAFSPDAKLLAGVRGDGLVRLWNLSDGKATDLPALKVDNPMEMAVARFSPDGKTLYACALKENQISRWDVESGKALDPVKADNLWIEDFTLLPDGKTLAAVGTGGTVLFDVASAKAEALPGMKGMAHTVAVSPDGKTLAAYYDSQGLAIWNLSKRQLWQELKDANTCEVLAFSADGATLATISDSIQLWNVSSRPGAEKIAVNQQTSAISQVKAEAQPRRRRLR